jgi:ankyrin repeat protein
MRQGRKEAAEILIEAGVDVNRVTDRGVFLGKNALCWAASQGRAALVSTLISSGADIVYNFMT